MIEFVITILKLKNSIVVFYGIANLAGSVS